MEHSIPLPHSLEAEQAVIGAILLSGKFDMTVDLTEKHFYDRRHQRIVRAIRQLKEGPIDLVTLASRLQEGDELARIGGVGYLTDLAQSVPTVANVDYYAGIVHERYLHRLTILELQRQLDEAWKLNATDAISGMQTAASALAEQALQSKEFRSIREVAIETYEQIEHRFNNRSENHVNGIPSGYADLDRMTCGFQRSDLIIVAARPSVGKTAFALNIAQHAGVQAKKKVGIFSLEMAAGQLVQRMLSAEQHIDAGKLRSGYLQSDDWDRLAVAVGSVAEADIHIDDTPAITVHEIAAKSRRLKKEQGLDLLLIDYLQLLAGSGKGDNRQQEVSEISRTLKQLARELDIPIIALSQLSRAVEQRQDKRPMMSDLRESGAIEQDADIVAFLYRDDYYDKESEKKNIIEVIIAKQRNGPVGTVELAFLKSFNKFVSLDRCHYDGAHQSLPSGQGRFPVPDMHRRKMSR
ncbi:replicative DNA helicase [Paenibacillus sp. YYML68]|uniref:replicative DNA helicase n=1 Tax=Paenibacillus sp. YYML68 TaxID=2909250 RepID=UPI0024907C9A|nr:replicative DNA helicase [Paenibacillus sp. YYML68]